MLIQLQLQNLAILKLELELLAVKVWVVFVDNAMVIETDDNKFVESLFCEQVK